MRVDATPVGVVVAAACKDQGTLDCTYSLMVSNALQPDYYTVGSNHMVGPFAMAIGTWHHLAVTFDGQTKIGYYDGSRAASSAVGALLSDTGNGISLGARGVSQSLWFQGTLDDIVFYDRVLTPAEIAWLAQ